MRDDRDRARGRDHEPDGEDADRTEVRPQLPERREERTGVEKRRKDRDEDEIRRELDGRDARHEPERQPAENEEDRVRDPHHRRDDEHRAHRDQQRQEDELLVRPEVHAASLRRGLGAAPYVIRWERMTASTLSTETANAIDVISAVA